MSSDFEMSHSSDLNTLDEEGLSRVSKLGQIAIKLGKTCKNIEKRIKSKPKKV